MPHCCIASFVAWGITNGFRLAQPGDVHVCAGCGRVYQMVAEAPGHPAVWTMIGLKAH